MGSGTGTITREIAAYFDETVAVEMNLVLKDCYVDGKIQLHTNDFMNANIKGMFDLVTCSHVIYHLNEQDMTQFINKLLSFVSPGGYCFIALMADRGQNHNFHKLFNSNYINSKQIKDILTKRKIPFEVHQACNSFTTTVRSEMCNLFKFFAIEDCSDKPIKQMTQDELNKINQNAEECTNDCEHARGFTCVQEEDYIISCNNLSLESPIFKLK